MWRDLMSYFRALAKHFVGLAGGAVVGFALLVWQNVLHKGDIPSSAWWIALFVGVFISGFLAWREEHARNEASERDPEVDVRRPQFEREMAKLSPIQLVSLQQVVRHGDRDAPTLRESLDQQGHGVDNSKADLILTQIAETGLIEAKNAGLATTATAPSQYSTSCLLNGPARPHQQISD
jgi:hypothetical protein